MCCKCDANWVSPRSNWNLFLWWELWLHCNSNLKYPQILQWILTFEIKLYTGSYFVLRCGIVQVGRVVPIFTKIYCLQLRGTRLIHIRKGQLYTKSGNKRLPSFMATNAHGLLTAPIPAPSSPLLQISLLCAFFFCPEVGSSNFAWNVRTKIYCVTF
jgi:hypothetical protein